MRKNSLSMNSQSGQAIVMVTLALMAMCGLLGLAVDFGWSFFVKRSAQAAADSAALAAVKEMQRISPRSGPYTCYGGSCRSNFVCDSSIVMAPPPDDNLKNGCMYARRLGFETGGRQAVRLLEDSGVTTTVSVPTRPGVVVRYYVTAIVTETVPQLFSAVMGNPWATVSARATAGIYEGIPDGSLRLYNREDDAINWGSGSDIAGVNLDGQATGGSGGGGNGGGGNGNGGGGGSQVTSPAVNAQGGMYMASACDGGVTTCGGGNGAGSRYSGILSGGTSVSAPFTKIRSTGTTSMSNNSTWTATPESGGEEGGGEFMDPTRGLPQMPLPQPASMTRVCLIPDGVIDSAATGAPIVLAPGYYIPVTQNGGNLVPSLSRKITLRGNVTFASSGTSPSCTSGQRSSTTFGEYFMFGGVEVNPGGSATTRVEFDPGRYVAAGVTSNNNGTAQTVFDASAGGDTTILGPGAGTMGMAIITTSGSGDPVYGYPGMDGHITRITALSPPNFVSLTSGTAAYKQGNARFQTGNNSSVLIEMDGLKSDAPGSFPAELKDYNDYLFWQDRGNSAVRYTADGHIPNDGSGTNCVGDQSRSCVKTVGGAEWNADGVLPNSPKISIDASPTVRLRGTIYQPRGGHLELGGGGAISAALRIFTGALKLTGGAQVTLVPRTSGPPTSLVALVE